MTPNSIDKNTQDKRIKLNLGSFFLFHSPPDPQGGVQTSSIDTALFPFGGRGGMKQKKTSKTNFMRLPCKNTLIGLLFILVMGACKGLFFEPNNWKQTITGIGSSSSPQAIDLNKDGVKDIVFGLSLIHI